MGLDIRWPIGLMFSIVGLLLAGYGLVTGGAIWGVVLLVFGGAMLALAKRAAGKTPEDKK
jgi:hypothetical protein